MPVLPFIWAFVSKRLKRAALALAVVATVAVSLWGAVKVHDRWVEAVREEVRQEVLQEVRNEDLRRAQEITRRVATVPRPRPVPADGVQLAPHQAGDTRGYRD